MKKEKEEKLVCITNLFDMNHYPSACLFLSFFLSLSLSNEYTVIYTVIQSSRTSIFEYHLRFVLFYIASLFDLNHLSAGLFWHKMQQLYLSIHLSMCIYISVLLPCETVAFPYSLGLDLLVSTLYFWLM